MSQKFVNLFLLIIWSSLAVGLLFRDSFLADEYRTPEWKRRLDLASIGAVVMVAWNLVRFTAARNRERANRLPDREGIRRPPTNLNGKNPEVIHPEFDFDAPPKPLDPPRNGQYPRN